MSDEQTTPPTPDAGESESVRTLQRIRETCADVEAWQVWSADGALLEAYPGELLDHIATLTAQLAAAKADGERLDKALRIAAGVVSTLPGWSDKHPQEAYDWIVAQSQTDAARTGAR